METLLRGRSGGHIGTALRILLERIARGCSPLRFRLGRLRVGRLISFGMNYAWGGWCRLSGLRVNGYFVCVGCVEKYDGDG